MYAFSGRRMMHFPVMLLVGASIGSVCGLAISAKPARAQNPDISTGSIRIIKGSGPVEYASSSAGIKLRLLKGAARTDYVLRPPRTVPTPQPARPILRTSASFPSEKTAANKASAPESIPLPFIRESHPVPSHDSSSAHSVSTSTDKAMPSSGNHKPSLLSKAATSDASAQIASPAQKPLLASPPPPAPRRDEGPNWPDRKALYDIVVLQVIGTVSASLLVSLAIVVSVVVLLRRLREQLPALVRVDAQPAPPPPVQPQTPPAPEFIVEETTAQPFDLGPTYEEEKRLKEEATRQQERAVLRVVFEDNLKLRQQLMELEAAAA